MTNKFKGYIFAAASAATYGTNPTFAVPLYEGGMNPVSVLFFRYLLAIPILLSIIFIRGYDLKLDKRYVLPVVSLGALMSVSSLTLFESYNYMNSGIASTILFLYPIMVSVIMMTFFKERFKWITIVCLVLASVGISLLYKNEHGDVLNTIGVILVVISSLTYAIYIVYVNLSPLNDVPTVKLIFYQLVVGIGVYLIAIACGKPFIMPGSVYQWGNVLGLAIFPTVLSFVWTTKAIHTIGSTPTAILGALEPLTAIVLGVILLGQTLSERECVGLILIILATTLVVSSDSMSRYFLRMRKMFPSQRKN